MDSRLSRENIVNRQSFYANEAAQSLRLLLIEDSDDDAALLQCRLQKSGLKFQLVRVEAEEAFRYELQHQVDLVISDFSIRQFGALAALDILKRDFPDVPLLIVSDAIGEETAVEAMKHGAIDYLLKDRLGRLPQAVLHGVEAARLRTKLRRKREDLTRAHVDLEKLSTQLIEAQEQERKSVARELHDELGQRLTVLNINLHRLHAYLHEADALAVWTHAADEVATLMSQVRELSVSLRPPALEHMGFEAAVRQLLERQFAGLGTICTFECRDLPAQLADAIAITAYRIIQESITNIVKHADAKHVAVSIRIGESGDRIDIEIRDDGRGFDQTGGTISGRTGNGLDGMEERVKLLGGRIAIRSAPGYGTSIEACLPLRRNTERTWREEFAEMGTLSN